MQHVSQATDAVVDQARDRRYPLTGTIDTYDIRTSAKDQSEYVVLTLDRGEGKEPTKAIAFDDKCGQVLDLIDRDVHPVRLFGYFERREFADAETGEVKTSSRFRVLWAGEPRVEDGKGKSRLTPRQNAPQRSQAPQQRQAGTGARPRASRRAPAPPSAHSRLSAPPSAARAARRPVASATGRAEPLPRGPSIRGTERGASEKGRAPFVVLRSARLPYRPRMPSCWLR